MALRLSVNKTLQACSRQPEYASPKGHQGFCLKKIAILLLVTLLTAVMLASAANAQQRRSRSSKQNMKLGLNRQMVTGYTFTIEAAGGAPSYDNAEGTQGNELYFEWVFSDRISFEMGSSITPMVRSYDLGVNGAFSSVSESSKITLTGANLYFGSAGSEGIVFFTGLATGKVAIAHEFTGGSLGDQTSSASVPVNTLKLGMDWVMAGANARLMYSMVSGDYSDSTSITGYKLSYDYKATILTLGVSAYF